MKCYTIILLLAPGYCSQCPNCLPLPGLPDHHRVKWERLMNPRLPSQLRLHTCAPIRAPPCCCSSCCCSHTAARAAACNRSSPTPHQRSAITTWMLKSLVRSPWFTVTFGAYDNSPLRVGARSWAGPRAGAGPGLRPGGLDPAARPSGRGEGERGRTRRRPLSALVRALGQTRLRV